MQKATFGSNYYLYAILRFDYCKKTTALKFGHLCKEKTLFFILETVTTVALY